MFDQLIEDLKRDEGFRRHVYDDHLGYATLGYGFLVDPRKGGGIPETVAEFWLDYVARRYWNELRNRLPWIEDQPEDVQRALANMAYQMGVRGVLGFRRMLAALEQGDRAGAAEEAMDSRWSRQTPERAQRVTELIRGEP